MCHDNLEKKLCFSYQNLTTTVYLMINVSDLTETGEAPQFAIK